MYIFLFLLFFFNDTATTEIYTLSLHDALPISTRRSELTQTPWDQGSMCPSGRTTGLGCGISSPRSRWTRFSWWQRSEEHTSELQSRLHLVCRLLLEKKKQLRSSFCWYHV